MNKPFKSLYEFTINKKEFVEETVNNEDGSKTIFKNEKEIPYKFFIKKPSGAERSAAELYTFRTYGEAVSTGVITAAILQKRIADEGGVFSRDEIKQRDSISTQMLKELADYKIVSNIKEEDRTEEQKTLLKDLDISIQKLSKQLKLYSDTENNLQMTAEIFTQNKQVIWWLLFLLFKENGDEKVSFFQGTDFIDRLESYNDIQDMDDEFYNAVLSKAWIAVRCWTALGEVNDDILKKLSASKDE